MTVVDPQDARDAADEILARPEFRKRPPSLVDRAFTWLNEQLSSVLSTVFGGDGGLLVGYGLLAGAAGVAFYLAWRHFPRRRLPKSAARVEVGTEIITMRSRSEWLERAAQAAADGRWGEAVHARYHALTAGLVDADELSPGPSTTSGEHRQRFAEAAASAPWRRSRFEQTVGRYEEVWFGEAPADAADVDAATAADDDLIRPR